MITAPHKRLKGLFFVNSAPILGHILTKLKAIFCLSGLLEAYRPPRGVCGGLAFPDLQIVRILRTRGMQTELCRRG